MARFRKKPVVIEARQFFYDQEEMDGVFYPEKSDDGRTWIGDAWVVTIHGQKAYLANGDWVITEPDGVHHYPCKPDIFEATYELSDVADEGGEGQNRWWEYDPNRGYVFTKTENHIFAPYRKDAQRIGDMSREELIAVIAAGYYERDLLAVACKAALENVSEMLTQETTNQLLDAIRLVTPMEDSPG